jgi:hypothetical protein
VVDVRNLQQFGCSKENFRGTNIDSRVGKCMQDEEMIIRRTKLCKEGKEWSRA